MEAHRAKNNGISGESEHFQWNTKTYICHYAIVPDIMLKLFPSSITSSFSDSLIQNCEDHQKQHSLIVYIRSTSIINRS
jgi:hypothetical protein